MVLHGPASRPGGAQADAEMRTRSPQPIGYWSGGHAVAWDRNAPETGDLTVGGNFQKHSYPWGIMINANGERFLDEGSDFRTTTLTPRKAASS